jgi:hypothetical protein
MIEFSPVALLHLAVNVVTVRVVARPQVFFERNLCGRHIEFRFDNFTVNGQVEDHSVNEVSDDVVRREGGNVGDHGHVAELQHRPLPSVGFAAHHGNG